MARAQRSLGSLGLGLALLLSSGGAQAAEEPEWVGPTMHQIFEALTYLLPRSIDPDRFQDAAERREITAQLDALAAAVGSLESHGRDSGASVRLLSLSLAEDVEEIRMRYAAEQYEEARYYLIGSIQNCIACHSRKPSDVRFPLAERLTDAMALPEISPHERALLFVITRRFDEALRSWEGLFKDEAISVVQFDFSGALLDYLTIAVRGTREYGRAHATLMTLSKRTDLPTYVRALLGLWTASLSRLERESEVPDSLARSRALLERARLQTEWPTDRGGLVDDLAASSILNQLVDAESRRIAAREERSLSDADLSEAFYLLGVSESRNLAGFWIDQSPGHLEAAVRADPGGASAAAAFRLLEELALRGYSQAQRELPADVWQKLEELRALAEPRASAGG